MAAAAEGGRWRRRGLLLVPEELVGGGDWERARRRESAFPRPAGGAGASHGSANLARGGAGRDACGAPSLPATRRRARAPHSPPLPAPPGLAALLASFPGSRHTSGRRADRRAHARAPWRTRTLASRGCSLCLVRGSPPLVPEGSRVSGVRNLAGSPGIHAGPRGLLQASPEMWSSGWRPLPQGPLFACLLSTFFLLMAKVNHFLNKSS